MNRFIHKTTQFVFSKQKSMFSSALLLAFMIVISRLFGFLRYRILAGYFSTEQLDIFFASFRIPDLVFELLITGALTSSFIPIYIQYQNNKEDLRTNISSIINVICIVLIVCIIILLLFLDPLIYLITPGYSSTKINEIITYSRFLLIGQLPFLVLGNILTGIGQANKIFLLSALAPIIYNLGIIISIVLFAGNLYLLAPVVGVILGASLFFVIQLPLLAKSDFNYSFILKRTEGLKKFVRITIPRIVSVLVAQIDATVDLTLTTFLGAGSYTIFYFAQHFQLLPVSVIGISFGQASLPYLSEIYQEGKMEEFKRIIIDSILNLFFLVIPIMSFFIFARTPLIRLFFGGEKFDWASTVQTAITLSFFSLSIPAHTIYYFLTRCYYAFLDTKTPFFVGLASILINTIISLFFIIILKLPVWSLAISFSISMTINSAVLFYLLYKKLGGMDLPFFFKESAKICLAALLSAVFSYYLMKLLDGLVFDTTRTINVFFLITTISFVFVSLYAFLSWFLNVREMYLITKLFIKAREYRNKIVELYTTYE